MGFGIFETCLVKETMNNKDDFSELLSNNKYNTVLESSQKKEKAGRFSADINLSKILRRVSLVEKMLFSRHLAVMSKAGLSFSRSLNVLSQQTKNKYFSEVISKVEGDIKGGESLADSLAKHPKVFNELFVNMVRVGETGGNLEEVLKNLAEQMKKDHEIISKVRGAMIYPAVIVFAMITIGVLMMIFVVPTLLATFQDLEVELPFATRMLVTVSNSFRDHGLLILGSLIISGWLFLAALKTAGGKKRFDFLALRLPVFGQIVKKVNLARFTRTLSSLIESGVSINEALNIISRTLGNTYYRESLSGAAKDIQKGVDLSGIVDRDKDLYPSLVINMIKVGEETGTLETTLKQIAEFYEEEVDQVTANLSSIIEPILMLIIGAAVGFFALSMIQPMYSLMEGIA